MSVLVVPRSADQESAVRAALDAVTPAHKRIHVLQLPSLSSLGPLLDEVDPESNYGVEYTVRRVPDTSAVVEFAADRDADCICIGVSERTATGKTRVDSLAQSVLLHEHVSGDLVVESEVLILRHLQYDT